ncbi:MAG TPA: glycosyl hydrolase 115 family protein [Tepidisphaeraceae bacterium]|nr:glycosyl hydrolase 115 family protein [Tepidisphaeraceae bacterium]
MLRSHHYWMSCVLGLFALAAISHPARAQEWSGPVRGSWIRDGVAQPGDVVLAEPGKPCRVVIRDDAHSAVKQAATFLASDLTQLCGQKIEVATAPPPAGGHVAVRLVTLGDGTELPPEVARGKLEGQWEAYQVVTTAGAVWLVGSDARGTAYAAYRLAEHLGIDPLYHWSGYRPMASERLVMKQANQLTPAPTVKYRGMFHDDEDILPRPFHHAGYPLSVGDVPNEWYARFFETALRLRMNMVAPYTRVHRRFEVQKMASDWGLFYTSHHYDILLSNPHGFTRYKLAEKRGVTGGWDWLKNRDNMIKYWGAGVRENGQLDCIWPVGLRGTDDHPYNFPKDTPVEEQNRVFREVLQAQIAETNKLVPEAKSPPVFHFTLYGEMLEKYLASGGNFNVPENVILIWPDDNDGRIRALPKGPNKWKHGVYYHLAYLWSKVSKQSANLVPANRVADSFKKIVEAGATEYVLVNVSELREFVREARMIAEICWDAEAALGDMPLRAMPEKPLAHVPVHATEPLPPDIPSPSSDRYARWFAAEYFGAAAADDVVEVYRRYEQLLDRSDKAWFGNDKVAGALNSLMAKFAGREFPPAHADTLPALVERAKQYDEAFAIAARARAKMTRAQRQFFHDLVELPLLMDRRPTQAAVLLVRAMSEPDREKAWSLCEEAMAPLEQLELEIKRAEHPPFDQWYRKTWVRHEETALNVHWSYEMLRAFLASGGTERLRRPPEAKIPQEVFVPMIIKD